ncbi:hypothetical protein [Kitasatospora sp. NPDC088783]|uniref:hypothetical protein n=1 Tax=Kitasatospora sp. NPDC088783 TaxID=3364077 RepID=UPI00381D62B2
MSSPHARRWSLRRLAQEAEVLPRIASEAAAEGVIDTNYLTEQDIVLVRLYGALKRHVWPGETRPANEEQGLRVWENLAVETARGALPDELQPDTGLFISQVRSTLATDPGSKCLALFQYAGEPFYYVPLGQWFEELPSRRNGQSAAA